MNTYIALLRGINVGGHKKVLMAELRELLIKSGFENVQTYIQSGNVIFQSSETITTLEENIQKIIFSHFGFDVPVLVKTSGDIQSILNKCPFLEDKKENAYFLMLQTVPEVHLVKEIELISYPNEEFIITNDCVYYYTSAGFGNAKCNNNFFERKLKVTATARNYKTMVKLLSLSSDLN